MSNTFFQILRKTTQRFSGLGLWKIPGVPRLYNALYRRWKPKEITEIDFIGGKMFVDARDEGIVPTLMIKGVYEPVETDIFRNFLRPGMAVADIGANIGYYTILAAQRVESRGKVVALEPDPHNYSILQKNIEGRYPWCMPIQTAVGTAAGTLTLYRDAHNLGNPSIAAANVPDHAGTVEVPVMTFDEVWEKFGDGRRLDVMKIDIQGAEGHLMAGATKTITAFHPTIFMELWPLGLKNAQTDPATLLTSLQDQGYNLGVVDEDRKEIVPTTIEDVLRRAQLDPGGWGHVDVVLTPNNV